MLKLEWVTLCEVFSLLNAHRNAVYFVVMAFNEPVAVSFECFFDQLDGENSYITADPFALILDGRIDGCATSTKRIENYVTLRC